MSEPTTLDQGTGSVADRAAEPDHARASEAAGTGKRRQLILAVGLGSLVVAAGALAVATLIPRAPVVPIRGLYGSGIAMDSKNNHYVGWRADQAVALRFRAVTASTLDEFAVNQRGGPGYSEGDGGTIEVRVHEDRAGVPTGPALASLTFRPGNPAGDWEARPTLRFPAPASLAKGRLYHLVFENVAPTAGTDYISINVSYAYEVTTPRQAAFDDAYAVLFRRDERWTLSANDTPVMDLGYGDGVRDGNAYYEIIAAEYGLVSGPSSMVRQQFTVSGAPRIVSEAAVRLKRIAGSAPVTLTLEDGDGTVIASGSVAGSSIPVSELPREPWTDAGLGGGRWVSLEIRTPLVLEDGRTYRLRVSTEAGTTYAAIPIRESDGSLGTPAWRSRAFRDGSGQVTVDGTTWRDLYEWAPTDLQFYLR